MVYYKTKSDYYCNLYIDKIISKFIIIEQLFL